MYWEKISRNSWTAHDLETDLWFEVSEHGCSALSYFTLKELWGSKEVIANTRTLNEAKCGAECYVLALKNPVVNQG